MLTLILMGAATALIGLLPTYEAIGVWAPILLILLRILQGISAGGEWGGAVLMAVEHAPKTKRGAVRRLAADRRAARPAARLRRHGAHGGHRPGRRVPRVGLAHPVPALASC